MVWSAEEACIAGFPALRQVIVHGWLLRISGPTRRTANSATPLQSVGGDPDRAIAACEALYRRHRQPAIFRIPSFLDPRIDGRLAELGYSAEAESRVIQGEIERIADAAAPTSAPVRVALRPSATPGWLAAVARLQNHAPAQHAAYRRVVEGIAAPAAFAEAIVDPGCDGAGETVAVAYGVVHRGLLCYESVVTDAGRRRQGHARRILCALAGWARVNGAVGACLQVEADNAPALALYDAIGLCTELYRYHYRRAPEPQIEADAQADAQA